MLINANKTIGFDFVFFTTRRCLDVCGVGLVSTNRKMNAYNELTNKINWNGVRAGERKHERQSVSMNEHEKTHTHTVKTKAESNDLEYNQQQINKYEI